MKRNRGNKFIIWLSLLVALLVSLASVTGLTVPGFYQAETPNWQAQTYGQDWVDLFIVVPCLLISSWLAWRGSKAALYIWAGVLTYLLYSFLIYAVAIHFNRMFLVYCFVLGLSFYGLGWFLFQLVSNPPLPENFRNIPRKFTAVYFIALSVLFYFLWLSEIIPSVLSGKTPPSVTDTGLFTNVVHVIDLSVFLPAIFITGVLLWRRSAPGFALAQVLLSFFVLMDITIGVLDLIMKQRGLTETMTMGWIMAGMALFSLVLLMLFVRRTGNTEGDPVL